MLNSLKSAGSVLLLTAICSPTLANETEPALAFESATKCIKVYDKMYTLQDQILARDLQVGNVYSHFQVAQMRYKDAIKRRDDLIAGTTDDDEILEFELANLNEAIVDFDKVRITTLSRVEDVMYGRKLMTRRLKDIRRQSLVCKGKVFDYDEVKQYCSGKTESQWCDRRF